MDPKSGDYPRLADPRPVAPVRAAGLWAVSAASPFRPPHREPRSTRPGAAEKLVFGGVQSGVESARIGPQAEQAEQRAADKCDHARRGEADRKDASPSANRSRSLRAALTCGSMVASLEVTL